MKDEGTHSEKSCREYVRYMSRYGDTCVKITSQEHHAKLIEEGQYLGLGVGSYERLCGPELFDRLRLWRPFIKLIILREPNM